ncbi:MAG: hypothetical protein EOM72_09150 [Opitutae bacterium]|nr:hypothetical protein [Opitutae bacterium]
MPWSAMCVECELMSPVASMGERLRLSPARAFRLPWVSSSCSWSWARKNASSSLRNARRGFALAAAGADFGAGFLATGFRTAFFGAVFFGAAFLAGAFFAGALFAGFLAAGLGAAFFGAGLRAGFFTGALETFLGAAGFFAAFFAGRAGFLTFFFGAVFFFVAILHLMCGEGYPCGTRNQARDSLRGCGV